MGDTFELAVCQMKVIKDKQQNIEKAADMIKTAAANGAKMVVLPEMFNCPYENSCFPLYAESMKSSMTLSKIAQAAKKSDVYIIAGSIPELYGQQLYNSSFIFNRKGELINVHRKMHLFDIHVPGKITFKESDILTAGNQITIVDTEFCKIGVGICYDIRFPELFRLMSLKGVKLVIVPGAFNMVTGPIHWEPLIRIRAIDNQVYLAAASPARNENASYIAYGNSMIVSPWGQILKRAEEKETIIYAPIDLNEVDRVRSELPLLDHRRTDIYDIVEKSKDKL